MYSGSRGNLKSGKSVLVKYALESELKKGRQQASMDKRVILSFFCHLRGTDLQQSLLGLYRSFLHQILDMIPDLLSDFSSVFKMK